MIFREEALGRSHDRDGTAERIGKFDRLLLRTRGAQLAADQQHRLLLAAQELRGGGDRGFQRLADRSAPQR